MPLCALACDEVQFCFSESQEETKAFLVRPALLLGSRFSPRAATINVAEPAHWLCLPERRSGTAARWVRRREVGKLVQQSVPRKPDPLLWRRRLLHEVEGAWATLRSVLAFFWLGLGKGAAPAHQALTCTRAGIRCKPWEKGSPGTTCTAPLACWPTWWCGFRTCRQAKNKSLPGVAADKYLARKACCL